MRYKFIHRDLGWDRPLNHYDLRKCPTCRALVSADRGDIRAHQRDHDETAELYAELRKRTGMAEEETGQDWAWGATVTGLEGADEDAIEAAE